MGVDNLVSKMRLLLLTCFIFFGIISNSVLGFNYGGFRRGVGFGSFDPPPEVAVDVGSIHNDIPKLRSNNQKYQVSVFNGKGKGFHNRISKSVIADSMNSYPNEKLSENLPTTSGMHQMVQDILARYHGKTPIIIGVPYPVVYEMPRPTPKPIMPKPPYTCRPPRSPRCRKRKGPMMLKPD